MNVTPYQRASIRHPHTKRVLATVTKTGEELHLDVATVLRLDEARIVGHELARWGIPGEWDDDPAPEQRPAPNDDPNGGGGAAAKA